MKKRWVLLLLVLTLFLSLFQGPAHGEAWPASREELAAENLTESDDWWIITGRYRAAAEKLAELWAKRNYGEDAVILSIQRVTNGTSLRVNVGKLLDGYHLLYSSTWEIQLIPQTLPDDFKQSDGVYTVSIQVVCLESEKGLYSTRSTLVGFLPPEKTFSDLFEVRAYLQEDPRFTDSLAELRTIVPEGVTEIDLRAILGDDVLDVENAWMLNADICVILRFLPGDGEDEDYYDDYEIILYDIQNRSILSGTLIPHVDYYYRQGWEDGAFYLLFEPEDARWYDPTFSYIKATIARDGTVDIDNPVPGRLTVMPGGKTAIRAADDGSLYAVDLATGEEDLLIQGVPGLGLFWDAGYSDEEIGELFPFMNEDYVANAEYVPFWDELPENWEDWPDGALPFEDDHNDIFAIRQFHVYKPLDEHRFVYTVSSWEWDSGYGVYDLQTRTDHRITGRGDFFGIGGDTLYGATLKADANTYESSLLPESVREQFAELDYYSFGEIDCDISPDGRLLALTGMKFRYSDASTVTITDLQTGDILKTYDIFNPFATEYTVAFYDDTHFMLFCRPEELGSAYIYLFNVEE